MTVRARLTLLSVALIAAALLLFGIAVRFGVERILRGSLDRDLAHQAEPLVHDGPFGPHGPGFGRPDMPPDRPFRPEPPFPGMSGGPEPRRPGMPGMPRRTFLPPRMFDAHGGGPIAYSLGGLQRAQDGQSGFATERGGDDEPIRVYFSPRFGDDGRVIGAVQTAASLAEIENAVRSVTATLLLLAPIVLLLAAAAGWALTDRMLRPVGHIAAAAERIGAANLSDRLPEEGHDEFAQLGATFNALLARLEASFARQRRFTADASHELRTPLAVIKAATSVAGGDPETLTPAERREAFAAIEEASDRAERLVRDLLLLARSENGKLPVVAEPVYVAELFADAIAAARTLAGGKPLPSITVDVAPDLVLPSDRHLLQRLVGNLLENALRHTPASGSVTLSARGGALIVADTGEGIAPEHLPRLGEPFYRVDPARSRASGGAGLGLSLCQAIATSLGGTLTIASPGIGKGTTVTVTL